MHIAETIKSKFKFYFLKKKSEEENFNITKHWTPCLVDYIQAYRTGPAKHIKELLAVITRGSTKFRQNSK